MFRSGPPTFIDHEAHPILIDWQAFLEMLMATARFGLAILGTLLLIGIGMAVLVMVAAARWSWRCSRRERTIE